MCLGHMEGTESRYGAPSVEDAATCCTAREVLTRVGDKWSVLVVALLGHQSMRFSELKRRIEGISQRMLTLTLRQLERDGRVARTVYPTVPARVDYALTPLGATLLETVQTLSAWAVEHRADIQAARRDYDERHAAPAPLPAG